MVDKLTRSFMVRWFTLLKFLLVEAMKNLLEF